MGDYLSDYDPIAHLIDRVTALEGSTPDLISVFLIGSAVEGMSGTLIPATAAILSDTGVSLDIPIDLIVPSGGGDVTVRVNSSASSPDTVQLQGAYLLLQDATGTNVASRSMDFGDAPTIVPGAASVSVKFVTAEASNAGTGITTTDDSTFTLPAGPISGRVSVYFGSV